MKYLYALIMLLYVSAVLAQGIPEDRNINIVGVNPPTATNAVRDPGLKQQNEPACAMKPGNPLHILCAFNDYRGVDDPSIGDAWEGYSYSINGGQTWFSDLLPGHPGDPVNIGLSFAADPQVAAAPGVALISYIAADRGENAEGGLFLQRMFEVNREAGAPWVAEQNTIEVRRGSADNFIDKPYMLLHPGTAESPTLRLNSVLQDGTPVSQEVPAARIFIAYTSFSDSTENTDLQSSIRVEVSDDYGASWKTQELANSSIKPKSSDRPYCRRQCDDKDKTSDAASDGRENDSLNEGHIKHHCKRYCHRFCHAKDDGEGEGINLEGHKKHRCKRHCKRFCNGDGDNNGKELIQSASIAATGDKVCAVWRRFENADAADAIMAACSTDRGDTFATPAELSAVPEFFPFDQGTTESTFRTNSYPVIATDGTQFYAFWASRIDTASPFFARIVYSTSVDGAIWTTPVMLEDVTNGHQFMPSVAAARGTIQLAWYDTRNNLFQADFIQDLPGEGAEADVDSSKIIRNMGDIRTAQITAGVATHSVQVSRYIEGAIEVDGPIEQLEFNFMNDRLFQQGTVPFAGDYLNVAAPTFRLEGLKWVSNIGSSATKVPVDFLISWSDTRDVRGNVWNDLVTPTVYTPADLTSDTMARSTVIESEAELSLKDGTDIQVAGGTPANKQTAIEPGSIRADAEPDPTDDYGVCVPGTNADRSRNQNVYSSVIRPGVSIDSPSASKPTGSVQRANVVWVSNNENTEQSYTLTIDNQPADAGENGRASFLQVPVAPFTSSDGLLTQVSVTIGANSTVSRTVYITSAELTEPEISVSVSDGGDIIYGTIKLNGDILSPDIQNPDIQNPDIQNPDIQNAEVHNPDIQNVVITRVANPDVQNPDIQNPDIQNPDIQNPDIQNPDIQNPDIQNPDIQNISLDGFNMENPDAANSTLTATQKEDGYTDITFDVTNNGNTTTSFNLDAFINGETEGLKTQLIASRTHVTETSLDCVQGKLVQNQIIFNQIDPDLALLSGNNDDGVFGDGSAYIAPGETIFVTLRVWGDPLLFEAERAGVRVESQSCNSENKTAGTVDCDPPMAQGNPTSAGIGFEFIPPLVLDAEIVGINSQLERFGVLWHQQGGILRLTDSATTGSFPPLSGAYIAFNTNIEGVGSHTAHFMCPDGSGRLATVTSASIDVADTEAVTVGAKSFNINGVLLEVFTLPVTGEPGNPGTFTFTSGPIASIRFIDSGGDGHVLDNLVYEGSECLPLETIITENVITGDTDILNSGVLVAANDLGASPSAVTINNVIFGADQGGLTGTWALGGGDFSTDPFSAELDSLLTNQQFSTSLDPVTLTISGLTIGKRYRLQLLFSNDLNLTGNNIQVSLEGATWVLDDWQDDAINLTSAFTASNTSVVVTFQPGPDYVPGSDPFDEPGRAVLSAYALHDISVP